MKRRLDSRGFYTEFPGPYLENRRSGRADEAIEREQLTYGGKC